MSKSLLVLLLLLCSNTLAAQTHELRSPDNKLLVTVSVDKKGVTYALSSDGSPLIRPSSLGFSFKHQPSLAMNLTTESTETNSHDEQWETVWGERRFIDDKHNALTVNVKETGTSERRFSIIFKAWNDGIAFRYFIPQQQDLNRLTITKEHTTFAFDRNFRAWWIPAYRNQRYEYQYSESALSSADVVHTPLTLEDDDVVMAIHEAALIDYPSMVLKNIDDNQIIFNADLVPWANGDKAYVQTPFFTPWRVIQVGTKAADLLNSDILLNLNAPPAPDTDTGYIKPGKYMGIWWEMHTGEKSWSPGENQGATTERAKTYIDFAAAHHIDSVLIEGWNKGWEGEWWQRKPTFSFTTPVEGFDLQEVTRYAASKGVTITGHHETAAGISWYENQMEDAFAYYRDLGIGSVKMGYVGTRLEGKEWHHGQFMVRHFNRVVRTAAEHGVMVNAHETIKGTGLSRTWPNIMTRESVRGMEYNGGSPDTGNLPSHTVIIPFTRGLAGPIDFTPGIFNFDYQKHRPYNRVPTTLAKQLALYVVLYSPLQMAADLPENYEGHPAFKWIEDVPVDWQSSVALDGEIGEFLVTARQDRHSENWYLGAVTNHEERQLTVSTHFLVPGKEYLVTRYEDAADSHWRTNPSAWQMKSERLKGGDTLQLNLAPGGGAALQFVPL